jgi:hypothetical protein
MQIPLPPFQGNAPEDGSQIHTSLPNNQVIPTGYDISFIRSDCWGVMVPGLPFVNGANSNFNNEMVMSWFLPYYDFPTQNNVLIAHAQRNYSHFFLSRRPDVPNEVVYNSALLAKKYGFWAFHFLSGKDFDSQDMTVQQYIAGAGVYLTGGITNRCIDGVIIAWEANSFNKPGNYDDITEYVCSICNPLNIPVYHHFTTRVTFWSLPGLGATQWWQKWIGKCKGLLYQGLSTQNSQWSQAYLQANMYDACNELYAASPEFDVVAFELCGMQLLYGQMTEEQSCAYGWIGLCAPNTKAIKGGSGARYPNGSWI